MIVTSLSVFVDLSADLLDIWGFSLFLSASVVANWFS